MRKIITLCAIVLTLCAFSGTLLAQNITQPYTEFQSFEVFKTRPIGYPVFDYNLEKMPFWTRDKLANSIFGATTSTLIYFAIYSKTGNPDEATVWAFIISNLISITKQSVIAIANHEKFNFCHVGSWMMGSGAVLVIMNITFDQGFKFALDR